MRAHRVSSVLWLLVALAPAAPILEPPCVVPVRDDPPPTPRCPEGMMAVAGRFCIDRWEASLVDKNTSRPLSPYYPPNRHLAVAIADSWDKLRFRMGKPRLRQMPLPPLPDWERDDDVEPMAVSVPGVVPSGYLSAVFAERACKNANKRLCRYGEWLLACQGQARRRYPYGNYYRKGACNTFRAMHPALELHGSPSVGHHDPRLNLLVDANGDPLLHVTGGTPDCRSEWDGDAAWDMYGNLDEWVDDPHGRLAGAFYARTRRYGCESSITEHPREYFDYSTGTRCCAAIEVAERSQR
jgi:hypothetical protein